VALEAVLVRCETAAKAAVAAADEKGGRRRRRLPAEAVVALRSDLDCALCCDLLCAPSTLPCGHTLCRNCVWRNLDHAFDSPPLCPLCRSNLSPYLTYLNTAARQVVRAILARPPLRLSSLLSCVAPLDGSARTTAVTTY
jgi:hypothetical protein